MPICRTNGFLLEFFGVSLIGGISKSVHLKVGKSEFVLSVLGFQLQGCLRVTLEGTVGGGEKQSIGDIKGKVETWFSKTSIRKTTVLDDHHVNFGDRVVFIMVQEHEEN